MKEINHKIKLVVWDLDDTLWQGTLAEGDEVDLFDNRKQIINTLNERGIVNSICSKNDFQKAKQKLEEFDFWNSFVFPKIDFLPKGQKITELLKEMNLRQENVLFIDDNIANLEEVKHYNNQINLLHVNEVDHLLENDYLKGKDDKDLTRLLQYKQLEQKTVAKKNFTNNDDFLNNLEIKIYLIDYRKELLDRIFELSDRTNQLNFTKNRMSKEDLKELCEDSSAETKCIHVKDKFGDNGIVGFYTLKNQKLIHFVFSCRIMNMGIEQWVYSYLKDPELEVVGEIASEVHKNMDMAGYIHLETIQEADTCISDEDIGYYLDEEQTVKIFGLGACDLYHTIAHLAQPNHILRYECNVFKGNERGVNVGTEYIRSCYDMNETEKEYCRQHFYNYTGSLAFNTKIFEDCYDYVILSFHDDMIFNIYENKSNPNIRVIRTDNLNRGLNSILSEGIPLDKTAQTNWLNTHFNPGFYISPKRFKDNILWIKNHLSEKTKLILINGPELDFFRTNFEHDSESLEQIIKLNRVIKELSKEYPEDIKMVDMNQIIKSREDVTNYVFHLKPSASYALAIQLFWAMIGSRDNQKKNILANLPIHNRKILIWGNDIYARNTFYTLRVGGIIPSGYIHHSKLGKIGTIEIQDAETYKDLKDQYYIVVADETNYTEIKAMLESWNYTVVKDFIRFKPVPYQKMWNEDTFQNKKV